MHCVPAELELCGRFFLGVALQETAQHRPKPRGKPIKLRSNWPANVVDMGRIRVQQMNDRLLSFAELRIARAALHADTNVVSIRQRQPAIKRMVDVERPAHDLEMAVGVASEGDRLSREGRRESIFPPIEHPIIRPSSSH
jgi:hypothetical protein